MRLGAAQLAVELGGEATERYLWVHNPFDRTQPFMLPVAHRLGFAGFAQYDRIGLFGGGCWALVYGGAGLPAGARSVLFTCEVLRWRSEARAVPVSVGDGYWTAAALGVFSTAHLETATGIVATTRLARSW